MRAFSQGEIGVNSFDRLFSGQKVDRMYMIYSMGKAVSGLRARVHGRKTCSDLVGLARIWSDDFRIILGRPRTARKDGTTKEERQSSRLSFAEGGARARGRGRRGGLSGGWSRPTVPKAVVIGVFAHSTRPVGRPLNPRAVPKGRGASSRSTRMTKPLLRFGPFSERLEVHSPKK